MKYYIANFSQIKQFNENCICIATTNSEPKFFHNDSYNKNTCFINNQNIILGIREEAFLLPGNSFEQLEEHCEPNCPWKYKNPNCGFLKAYKAHLQTINFNWLLREFERVAEDVRKVTHFCGEPIIILLVWEAANNPCSERHAIKELFAEHNILLEDWNNIV